MLSAAVSALSSARSAIDSASSRLDASSHRVASMLPRSLERLEPQAVDPTAQVTQPEEAPAAVEELSLAREFVEQRLALVQGLAGIRVLETELELLGALVDMKA